MADFLEAESGSTCIYSRTLLITTQRSRLTDDIVEAVECLKHWYMAKLFE
jgi:hypothetical protein